MFFPSPGGSGPEKGLQRPYSGRTVTGKREPRICSLFRAKSNRNEALVRIPGGVHPERGYPFFLSLFFFSPLSPSRLSLFFFSSSSLLSLLLASLSLLLLSSLFFSPAGNERFHMRSVTTRSRSPSLSSLNSDQVLGFESAWSDLPPRPRVDPRCTRYFHRSFDGSEPGKYVQGVFVGCRQSVLWREAVIDRDDDGLGGVGEREKEKREKKGHPFSGWTPPGMRTSASFRFDLARNREQKRRRREREARRRERREGEEREKGAPLFRVDTTRNADQRLIPV